MSLAEMVRDKLATGTLPLEDPVKLWAGHGRGQPCAACEQPILEAQVEYEPQYEGRQPIRLHAGCHGLWEAERHRRRYLLPIEPHTAMPEKAALIAVLITDQPLCLACASDKSGLAANEVESYLRRAERVITLKRGTDRCRACGNSTEVFSMFQPD